MRNESLDATVTNAIMSEYSEILMEDEEVGSENGSDDSMLNLIENYTRLSITEELPSFDITVDDDKTNDDYEDLLRTYNNLYERYQELSKREEEREKEMKRKDEENNVVVKNAKDREKELRERLTSMEKWLQEEMENHDRDYEAGVRERRELNNKCKQLEEMFFMKERELAQRKNCNCENENTKINVLQDTIKEQEEVIKILLEDDRVLIEQEIKEMKNDIMETNLKNKEQEEVINQLKERKNVLEEEMERIQDELTKQKNVQRVEKVEKENSSVNGYCDENGNYYWFGNNNRDNDIDIKNGARTIKDSNDNVSTIKGRNDNINRDGLPKMEPKKPWKEGTILVVGDSLIGGVQEKKMGSLYKVRSFPGAVVNDFYYFLTPLLEKKPESIILMAGTNDAILKSSDEILKDLLKLRDYIVEKVPECKVYISCPTPRVDDWWAKLVVRNLRGKLLETLGSDWVITNKNIDYTELSKGGLHLNGRGTGRLAMNFLAHMRGRN